MAAGLMSAATVASASPVLIGIGDQGQATLVDPRFTQLAIGTVRIVLPWDVVATDPARLDGWVQATRALGIEPFIAFGRSISDRCPGSPCRLPSEAEYRADFAEVHRRYPWIRVFAAWNEPNHGREPTWNNPTAAAHYTDIVAQECPECTVVGADVLDAPGFLNYVASYKAALTTAPTVWGLHNYYDTTYFQSTGTKGFLSVVDGPVWLTESGGIVTWRSPDGRVQLPYDEARAAASLSFGLRLAAAHADRVARMYVYQWKQGPADDFDAGLIRPDGNERPALAVLRAALGQPGGLGSAGAPGPARLLVPPPKPTSGVALGRVRLGRRGAVQAQIRCTFGHCRGGLTLEGVGRIAERLVNGRTMRGTLAPRRVRFDMKARSKQTLRMRLPPAVLRRAVHRRLRLRESAVPSLPGAFIARRRVVQLRLPYL